VLLIHGLSSIAGTWWRIGPALAARGWDVSAVDQAGHGGRPVRGEVDAAGLAAAVLEVHPEAPDVLIGHSLGRWRRSACSSESRAGRAR
jgi:pimeloyl-ACP methyl ester carboxylesterase